MKEASGKLEYERAALLRDQIMELKSGGNITPAMTKKKKAKPSKGSKGRKR